MRIILIAAVAALATACATQPAYQARGQGDRYGHSEVQVEPNRVLVSYIGESSTSRETVEVYLLYRAAETTLEHGYDYFVIAGHDVSTQSRLERTGARPRLGGMYAEVASHTAALDIVMYAGNPPTNTPNAYAARAVQQSLGARVRQAS